ncbi:MAG: hypothetical protein KF832_31075 [Caldilineaceae bacterium]|nr:hypothetical protein [Caldilineaceae bacterium]
MINSLQVLRSYLASQAALTTLVGTRLYAGRLYPPKNYLPGQRAICFNGRGGQLDYTAQLLRESMQFKCYGADAVDAMNLYGVLVEVLHDQQGAGFWHAGLEVTGYPLQEPETDWPFVLVFFSIAFMTQLGE